MSSQDNTSRRSRSRTHSHADRNTRERSRVSNVSIQATLGPTQDSMTALHISNISAERDHPPSYPSSLNSNTPANHLPRADATTQSLAHPYTTSSKPTDKARRMPGHRQTRPNVGNNINNPHISTLASRNVGQLPSAGRSGHGNQGGGTESLEKAQITRLEYVPPASFESIHISTGSVHQEPEPNSRVDVTQARGEMRSHYSSFFSKLSPLGSTSHSYYTEFESTMLSKELTTKSHGYYLEYMKCNILEQSSHIPLFRPSPVSDIKPGDVGQFQADGSFRSLFNMYLTAQENIKRFNQEPPEGFKPFEGNSVVFKDTRTDSILTRGAPSGPEHLDQLGNPLKWMGHTYVLKISPNLSDTVSALIFTSSTYKIYKLRTLSNVKKYLESQLKSWYNGVMPNLKKKDRNGRLVLVEGTYVTDAAVGLLHYSRDKARKVKPDDIIIGTFEPRLSTMTTTSDIGGQAYNYVWNITGPGSSQANLKRTMIEPAQFNGNHICFGIVALSLWEK